MEGYLSTLCLLTYNILTLTVHDIYLYFDIFLIVFLLSLWRVFTPYTANELGRIEENDTFGES